MATPEKADSAAASASSPTKLQLKLLVDQLSCRVLYAEAGKDTVDFLLGCLRLPIGLTAKLLSKSSIQQAGSLRNLYASAQSLGDSYLMSPSTDREALLNPSLPSPVLPFLNEPVPITPGPRKFYRCAGYNMPCRGNPTNMTDVGGTPCPACRQPMTVEMRWAPGDAYSKLEKSAWQEGYVKGVVTYLVMDDLTISPMSTISAIMLLNKFNITDCSILQELTVDLGIIEGLKLLKASMESNDGADGRVPGKERQRGRHRSQLPMTSIPLPAAGS